MTTTLDDLPLPVPTHFRNGVLYAFSADQIRADREMVWELAMRKAQEGRGPVVLPDGFFDALSDLLGDSNMAERVHRLITSWCDTSPPPKSDEARDALLAARDYVQQALNEHDRMYCRHPATESDRKLIVDDLARVDAALAAQQKGNK